MNLQLKEKIFASEFQSAYFDPSSCRYFLGVYSSIVRRRKWTQYFSFRMLNRMLITSLLTLYDCHIFICATDASGRWQKEIHLPKILIDSEHFTYWFISDGSWCFLWSSEDQKKERKKCQIWELYNWRHCSSSGKHLSRNRATRKMLSVRKGFQSQIALVNILYLSDKNRYSTERVRSGRT